MADSEGRKLFTAVAKRVSDAITSPPARSWVKVANTASSRVLGTGVQDMELQAEGGSRCLQLPNCEAAVGLVGLTRTASTAAAGTASCMISAASA